MNNTLEYKGYKGSIEFSEEDKIFHGKVLGIGALISYEGNTVQELLEDFHAGIDQYLELCEEQGVEPEVPYNGTFSVRIDPDVRRSSEIYAATHAMTLSNVVEQALRQMVAAQ